MDESKSMIGERTWGSSSDVEIFGLHSQRFRGNFPSNFAVTKDGSTILVAPEFCIAKLIERAACL